MRRLTIAGETSELTYAVAAPLLLASQHLAVWIAYRLADYPLEFGFGFFLLPIRQIATLPGLTPVGAAIALGFMLLVNWALAVLSFRRAKWSRRGFALAPLAVLPVVQYAAVVILAVMPRGPEAEVEGPPPGVDHASMILGVMVGSAMIVVAVLISAVTFGAYGWGLFVMTPFTVGVATGYIANRRRLLTLGHTMQLATTATILGGAALLLTALEGLACLIIIAPLGLIVALAGGAMGRGMALHANQTDPPLFSLALVPLFFALEAAMPPAVAIETVSAIEIAASPAATWKALISDDAIALPPGFVGRMGLAYPIRGHVAGGERLGEFSTGIARERITVWKPGRELAFVVLDQPPAMEEMSPYRKVFAPHVEGYFATNRTAFTLTTLPAGRTRLTVRASHILRIEPVPYFEPIAKWAIGKNTGRVLKHVQNVAEAAARKGH